MELLFLLKSYQEGNMPHAEAVSLFFKIYPEKRSALEHILSVEDKFSRNKVKEGLEAKHQEFEINRQTNKFKTYSPSKHKEKPIDVSALPENLRAEHAKLSPLIREISQLHARLPFALSNKDRHEMAVNIVEKVAERRSIFNQIDAYLNGEEVQKPEINPEPADSKNIDILNYKINYELNKLRVRRSKAKKKNPTLYNQLDAQIKVLEKQRY
jgi:hypothetical protein